MKPTKFNDLNELLADFTAEHKRILGYNLIGLYLQGSAAVGGMDEYSDVDFVAVVREDFNQSELEQMQALTLDFYNRKNDVQWAEHLEGSYFPLELLKAFDRPEETAWYNDNGSQVLERSTHCNTLVVRWCLYKYAIPLCGPDFKTLMGPVSTAAIQAEIFDVMIDWGAEILERGVDSNCFYQQFITASYCRMLHTLTIGRIDSKQAGLNWSKTNLDPEWHSLFDQVLADRDNSGVLARKPANPDEMQRALDFVVYANRIAETLMSQEQTDVG